MKVRDVMSVDVETAGPAAPFPELVEHLLRRGISGLPIVDDRGNVLGIVTEADLVSKEAYGGHRRRALEVLADLVSGGETEWVEKGKGRSAAQVMTTPVEVAGPSDDIRVAARRMLDHQLKRLPVVEGDRLVGIVSRTDLLRALHRTDDELTADLVGLLADPMRAPEGHSVTVTASEGVVTVRGSVQFPVDIGVVTAMIWQVPGVVDVHNEATARQRDPGDA